MFIEQKSNMSHKHNMKRVVAIDSLNQSASSEVSMQEMEGGSSGENYTVVYPLVKDPSDLKVDSDLMERLLDGTSAEGRVWWPRYEKEAKNDAKRTGMICQWKKLLELMEEETKGKDGSAAMADK